MSYLNRHLLLAIVVGFALFCSGALFSSLVSMSSWGVFSPPPSSSSSYEEQERGALARRWGINASTSSTAAKENDASGRQPSRLASNSSNKNNTALLFVHFHKSGGSSVCQTIRLAGTVPMTDVNGHERSPVRNCNAELTGPANDKKLYGSLQTCRVLNLYADGLEDVVDDGTPRRTTPFGRRNFVAVEVPLIETLPCPGFRSFAIMRRPVERALSHMRFHNLTPDDLMRYMNEKKSYHVVNSYFIRMLLGRSRFSDYRPVDEHDLELAKKQVDRFDAFVPLEHLHHDHVLDVLRERIPEYYEGLVKFPNLVKNQSQKKRRVEAGGGGNVKKDDKYSSGGDMELLKRLEEENIYDTLLYKYMLEKLEIDE